MNNKEAIAQHLEELGQFALLKVLEGKLTIDEATEGLYKRRIELLGPTYSGL